MASDTSAPTPPTGFSYYAEGIGIGYADSAGPYEVILPANRTYAATSSLSVVRDAKTVGSAHFPNTARIVSLGTGATQDFNFPAFPAFVVFTGKVTNSSGQPVRGVHVGACSSSLTGAADLSYSGTALTDMAGNYELVLLRGVEYTFIFTPPTSLSSSSPASGAK